MENNAHHILVTGCKTSLTDDLKPAPHGESYLVADGLWVDHEGASMIGDPKRPRPMTKKNDVETGEDQKGQ